MAVIQEAKFKAKFTAQRLNKSRKPVGKPEPLVAGCNTILVNSRRIGIGVMPMTGALLVDPNIRIYTPEEVNQ